jgi:hypothetical protein
MGGAEVALPIVAVVEVPTFTTTDRLLAARADCLAAGDEGLKSLAEGAVVGVVLVGEPNAATIPRAVLSGPFSPTFWFRWHNLAF